jgi:hypothetical protein
MFSALSVRHMHAYTLILMAILILCQPVLGEMDYCRSATSCTGATLSADKSDVLPGEEFTLEVCSAEQPYILYGEDAIADTAFGAPILESSTEPNMTTRSQGEYHVDTPSSECQRFVFSTTESTREYNYLYSLNELGPGKGNSSYVRVLVAIPTSTPTPAPTPTPTETMTEAPTEVPTTVVTTEVTTVIPTPTEVMTPTPTEIATPEVTQVQTIGELAGVTVAPTYAPRVTQDYDVRIAALEAQNAELISEQQAQRSLLDQLLALLGLS